MATTTPNFGWPVPTSTDLVKDGATAIEALGDSIDASLLDLKGGTTGQVLSKTTNTDMDFTWVTTDDANAIQNSIVDAKGDLIAATANDTPARLAVGTNGQVLTADSTAATGLAWATASVGSTNVAGKNAVLNSNFSVWQRGTSFSASGAAADRWFINPSGATATFTRQVTNDTTNLPFIQYCARFQRTAGNTSTATTFLNNSFETINSIPFVGKTVTLSFYARAGANYSAASGHLVGTLYSGTGTDQNYNSVAYTGSNSVASTNAVLTTTWQRFTVSGTVPTSATELAVVFLSTPVGTAGANDYYEITGVQLEIASSASSYSPNAATFQGELAACQRYYYLHASGGSALIGSGSYNTASNANAAVIFPVQMRTAPTLVATTGTNYYQVTGGGVDDNVNSLTIFIPTVQATQLYNNSEASGTIGYGVIMRTSNAAASVAFNAEL